MNDATVSIETRSFSCTRSKEALSVASWKLLQLQTPAPRLPHWDTWPHGHMPQGGNPRRRSTFCTTPSWARTDTRYRPRRGATAPARQKGSMASRRESGLDEARVQLARGGGAGCPAPRGVKNASRGKAVERWRRGCGAQRARCGARGATVQSRRRSAKPTLLRRTRKQARDREEQRWWPQNTTHTPTEQDQVGIWVGPPALVRVGAGAKCSPPVQISVAISSVSKYG